MIETTITLRPKVEYALIPVQRLFSDWPEWLKKPLTLLWPEVKRGGITHEWRKKRLESASSQAGRAG